jgi:hypothetical protein
MLAGALAAVAIAGTAWAATRPSHDGRVEAGQTVVARYSFDDGHPLRTVAVNGGKVTAVRHGAGMAVQFPRKCSGGGCPRVVLQAASTAALNPGAAAFRYGASVLLRRDQTTAGQNVLQKGYSAAGGQYKLQVDGSAGRPSCVLVGSRIFLARSTVTAADGGWHRLECRRDGGVLLVVVDGVARGRASVPSGLSIRNSAPLSLGGKGAYPDNDQFRGALDDVWVSRG